MNKKLIKIYAIVIKNNGMVIFFFALFSTQKSYHIGYNPGTIKIVNGAIVSIHVCFDKETLL